MKGRICNKNHGNVPKGAIFIGRPSKYGNPFIKGIHGTRAEVIEKFRHYLLEEIENGNITLDEIRYLYECDLVCYCHPLPCHGDVYHEFGRLLYNIDRESEECQTHCCSNKPY